MNHKKEVISPHSLSWLPWDCVKMHHTLGFPLRLSVSASVLVKKTASEPEHALMVIYTVALLVSCLMRFLSLPFSTLPDNVWSWFWGQYRPGIVSWGHPIFEGKRIWACRPQRLDILLIFHMLVATRNYAKFYVSAKSQVRECGFPGVSVDMKIQSVANTEVLLVDSSTIKTARLVSKIIWELAVALLVKKTL